MSEYKVDIGTYFAYSLNGYVCRLISIDADHSLLRFEDGSECLWDTQSLIGPNSCFRPLKEHEVLVKKLSGQLGRI